MLFSQIIDSLKNGDAGIQSFQLKNNPEIQGGQSIELANSNDLTFLEAKNSLSSQLNITNAGAILIPDEESL